MVVTNYVDTFLINISILYIILPQRWDYGFESVLGHYLVCLSETPN